MKERSRENLVHLWLNDAANGRWIARVMLDSNQSKTAVIERCIECCRTGQPFEIAVKPSYAERAIERREKRHKKLAAEAGDA